MDDEHAGGQARVFLGRVVARRQAVDAGERAGDGVPADSEGISRGGAAADGELAFRQEYMCEFGDNEMSVFSEDSILAP